MLETHRELNFKKDEKRLVSTEKDIWKEDFGRAMVETVTVLRNLEED